MSEEFKLAPERWCLRTGIRVMDPDGWDRKNYEESWRKPITRDEFLVRARSSTCMAWPRPLYDEKWKDKERKPAEHPSFDYCNCQDSWEHNQILRSLGEQKQIKDVETMNKKAEAAVESNPLLDILNSLITPKTASSPIDFSEMLEAATSLHKMFEVFVKAGFTESQSLVLVGGMLKSNS